MWHWQEIILQTSSISAFSYLLFWGSRDHLRHQIMPNIFDMKISSLLLVVNSSKVLNLCGLVLWLRGNLFKMHITGKGELF